MAKAKWLYEKATGRFTVGGFFDPQPFDGVLIGLVEFGDAAEPDPRLHRFDAVLGKRPATAPEIAAYDAEQADLRATSEFDVQLALKALALVYLDEINTIRAALVPVLPPRTGAQLKAAYIAKRKALG